MNRLLRARLLAAGALLALSTQAQAQYRWIDANSIQQFSERVREPHRIDKVLSGCR